MRWRRPAVGSPETAVVRSFGTLGRTAAVLAACSAAVLGLAATGTERAGAAVPACSTAGIGVTALHGPVFYIDPGNSPALTSAYAGYSVTNQTGGPLSDAWVELSGFTGGSVALGSGQPAAEQVPALATGASRSLFWYLTASGASASAQGHTVTVYSHQPGLANASVLCTATGGFSSVATTIGANANKITSVSLSTAAPTIGSTFSITVNGNTGTIGQGPPAPSADPQALWMSPSAISGWPAAAYRLVGTRLSISPDGAAAVQDNTDVLHLTGLGSASRDYTATYTFQATGFTASNSTLLPVEQISSGTQVKHTGSYPATIPAIAPATNDLAVAVAATPTRLPSAGGTVAYTATIAGTTGASLDSFTLTAPAGAAVVPGSASFDGASLADPVGDASGHLVFQGPFTLTPGADALQFSLAYGASPGPKQTTLTGTVGAATIDTTPGDLTDNSPASTTIWVNTSPVAATDAATVAANGGPTAIPVLGNDTDVDGDSLTVTGLTQPAHGSATYSATGVSYAPAAGYTGSDSFTYAISDGNGGTATGTVTVTVNPSAGQTISFPQPPDATLLSDVVVLAASDAGLPITYRAVTPGVCTVDAVSGAVSLVTTGTCTVEADQAGDAGHAAAAPAQRSFTVTRAEQAITFPQPPDVPLAAATATVSAASDSLLAVHFDSLTDTICTVDPASGAVRLLDTGTCTVAATQPGNDTYAPAPAVDRSFAVTTSDQTITFDQPGTVGIAAGPVTLHAVSGSGLAVSFSSLTPDVCATTADGSVQPQTAGTCTVQADQAGDAAYTAAAAVQRSFTVTEPVRAGQALSLAPIPDTALLAGSASASATSDSGLPVTYSSTTSSTCSVDPATGAVDLLAVGTCTVRADQAGDATHVAAAPAEQSFAITRTDQRIAFSTPSDAPLLAGTTTLAAAADSGLPVGFESVTLSRCSVDPASGVVTLLTPGDCTIEATQAGSAEYAPAPSVQRTFAVVRSAQALTFPALPDSRVGDTVAPTASAGSGLPVTYTAGPADVCVLDPDGTGVSLTGPGTCTVEAAQAGNDAYLPASADATLTVLPTLLPQTITVRAVPDTPVTSADLQVSATSSSGLAVAYDTRTPAVCDVTPTGAVLLRATGICTIQADQNGNGVYAAAASATTSFAVVRAAQRIDFPDPADAWISDAVAVSATATSGLPVSYSSATPATCSVASSGAVGLLAGGACSIAAAQPGSDAYAPADPVTRTFRITLLPQTITLTAPASEDVSIGSVAVAATSDAGLPVVLTAGPAAVCALAGTRSVRLAGSGHCLLTATAAGDSTHLPADPASATFAVTVQAGNKAYTVPPAQVSTGSGSSGITLDLLAGNPAGQTLVGVTQPRTGRATLVGQRVELAVPPAYKGTETFTYTTKDQSGALHTATVTITVPNSPPTVKAADTSTVAGTDRQVVVRLADPNHDPLSVSIGAHSGAHVTLRGDYLRVVPDLSFSGNLAIPVAVSDHDGGVARTTVHVLVRPRPTPVATRYLVARGSRVIWHAVPTSRAHYLIRVDGQPGCLTTATSCTLGRLVGPRASVTVTVLGANGTTSTATLARPQSGHAQLAGVVYFATDSAVVSPYETAVVRNLTRRLTEDGFSAITIVGYTDSRGSAWYNQALSERRARAVDRLVHLEARVTTHVGWHGESGPAATNSTPHGRALNRRAELWVD